MKKIMRILGVAMLSILISTAFTACDDNDDNFNPSDYTEQDNALVGTWQYVKAGTGWGDTETITFYANGTYDETDIEIDNKGTETTWERGTWNTNSTKNQVMLKITASSDPSEVGDFDIENYKVSNGELLLDRTTYKSVPNP